MAPARPCRAAGACAWRLAAALFGASDVLLLDEPTNYLDLEGTIWLKSYIRDYPHTILLVSHDRDLLNEAVDLDPASRSRQARRSIRATTTASSASAARSRR